MFKLVKYYFDAISEQGQCFIGYAAQLSLLGMTLPWRASLVSGVNGTVVQQGVGRFNYHITPSHTDFTIPAYQLQGKWYSSMTLPKQRLLNLPHIQIDWQVLNARSEAALVFPGQTMSGLGYAECLEIHFRKPQLPFTELYWGRFIADSSDYFLIWLNFNGAKSKTLVIDPFGCYTTAKIALSGIIVEHAQLHLQHHTTLLESSISSHLPHWLSAVCGNVTKGQENKYLARGRLVDGRQNNSHTGWAIHEVVRW